MMRNGFGAYLLSAFISVVLLEIALQAYYRVTVDGYLFERMAIPIYVADSTRCYALRPNLDYVHRTAEYEVRYQTDVNGFRVAAPDQAIRAEKEDGSNRILFLGPSYAFGWANTFEDSYAASIARLLGSDEKRFDVLNLGTPGQSVAQQLCWTKQKAAEYQPDLVVQTVFGWPGNVVTECNTAWCPDVENGFLLNRGASLRAQFVEIAKKSAIIFYGWYLVQRFLLAEDAPNDDSPLDPEVVEDVAEDEISGRYQGYLSLVHRALGNEVPVVFVFIPYSYAVRPGYSARWGIFDRQLALDTRVSASTQIAALRKQGIPIVDPTEALVAADAKEPVYFFVDTHLTPAGNRVVAEEVVREVRRSFNY